MDSLSPKSDAPASIEQLVMEAEDLVIIRRRPKRMVSSKVRGAAKNQQFEGSESENDHHDYNDTIEGMDCRRDVYRRSLQSSSSLSHLLDSLIVHPDENEGSEKMLSLSDVENDNEDVLRHRRRLFPGEDCSSNDGSQLSVDEHDGVDNDDDEEEEEDGEEVADGQLSEFWDQVSRKNIDLKIIK